MCLCSCEVVYVSVQYIPRHKSELFPAFHNVSKSSLHVHYIQWQCHNTYLRVVRFFVHKSLFSIESERILRTTIMFKQYSVIFVQA
jgi:hypothetical protein